ncbi:HDL407Wp [Eremothecium sinecaudum]|uniref:HDL407Wp n=1 Tax=Eremothecium sinecaudum TaxID=45286 RepID=A0A0X8HRW3_9SACH|nr:HDL407Wp [Eremothecium sinecaudum]AMD20337.1 HDL407Wp [Eremothecium sinecaudum]
MEDEKTKYSSSILTSKKPFEVTEITKIRLSHAKFINREFYVLFKELSDLRKNYIQQLRKIIVVNENLDKLIYNESLQNHLLSESELARMEFDWLGGLREVWSNVIEGLKVDMQSKIKEYKVLDREILVSLDEQNNSDANWQEATNLSKELSKVAQDLALSRGSQEDIAKAEIKWAEKAPYLLEKLELTDENRLAMLKNSILQYQNIISDSYQSALHENENIMNSLLEFNPNEEIDRFGSAVMDHEFTFDPPSKDSKESFILSRKKSFQFSSFGESNSRQASINSTMKNSILTGNFFDSASNSPHRKRNKLRSKVGSIFGVRKNSKSATPHDEVIHEIDLSSTNSPAQVTVNSAPVPEPKHQSMSDRQSEKQSQPQPETGKEETQPERVIKPLSNSSTNMSIYQTPLKPQLRSKHSSEQPEMIPERSPQKTEGVVSGQADLGKQTYGEHPQPSAPSVKNKGSDYHIKLPPPRKTASQTQKPVQPSSGIEEDVIANDGDQMKSSQASSDENKGRRDVQSSLFHNMPSATTINSSQALHTAQLSADSKSYEKQHVDSSLNMSSLPSQSIFQHTELNGNGLTASIGEIVNAKFKDGILTSSHLLGEVALNYSLPEGSDDELPLEIHLKMESETPFDKLTVNNSFMERTLDNTNFIYKLNPQYVFRRTLGALKYSLKTSLVPIVIHPAWKFEETQASVMLTIKIFSGLPATVKELVLHNLIVSVAIENAVATSALSKPQGSFSKEKKRVTWRFKEPVVLRRDTEERLIARFITESLAKESAKGVQTRFTIRGFQLAGEFSLKSQELSVDDPFGAAVEGSWNTVPVRRTLISGAYYGLSV